MKKRYLIFGVLLALSLSLFCLAFAGCDEDKPKEKVPEITERVRYSDKTNPFAELTWQEYIDLFDTDEQTAGEYWQDKMANAAIYYQFEGSYSEAYQGNYSRTFLYMNCYEDGSLHATYGNENYYGYWTNVDKRNNMSLVLHIVRYNDKEYNNGIYESVCDSYVHNYYEYASTVIWNQWGTRTVLIYGSHYSPVKSLTVSGGQTKYMLGESFSTTGLAVTVTRENGKSIDIDEQSFPQKDCRVKFAGFDAKKKGKKTVTVSHVYSDVTTSYDVEVVGIKSIAADAKDAKTKYHLGDAFETTGIVVTATREDGETAEIKPEKCKFEGYDASKEGKQTVTISYSVDVTETDGEGNETTTPLKFETNFEVEVVGVKSFEIDASNAPKEFFVGDKLSTDGLVVKATFKDDVTDVIAADRCTFTGFDSGSATDSQTVTVGFQGFEQTYDVKIIAPTFKGTGNYNGTSGEIGITILSPQECDVTFGNKTARLNYKTMNADGKTVYNLVRPAGDTSLTDDEWKGLHKQYIFDREELTLAMTTVYEIPSNGANRQSQEPMPGIGGNTELRYIFVDKEAGTATITYKYWYAANTDTFVCKYTLEEGVLTFTECISSKVGGNNSQFANLYKTWTLGDDFSAVKYAPPAN